MNDISYQQYIKDISQYPLITLEEENELAACIKIRNEYKGEPPQEVLTKAQSAIDKLVVSNLRLVITIANNVTKRPGDRMDLISEGNRGLMRAAETFDPTKGAKFSTYSSFWVKHYLNKYIYRTGDLFKLPDKVWSNKYRVSHFIEEYEHTHGCKPSIELIATSLEISVTAVNNIYDLARKTVSIDSSVSADTGDTKNEEITITDCDRTPDNYSMSLEAGVLVQDLLASLPERERNIIIRRYGLNCCEEDTLHDIGNSLGLTQERIRQLEASTLKLMRSKLANIDITENPIGVAYV